MLSLLQHTYYYDYRGFAGPYIRLFRGHGPGLGEYLQNRVRIKNQMRGYKLHVTWCVHLKQYAEPRLDCLNSGRFEGFFFV
jgi:hypothetical protein